MKANYIGKEFGYLTIVKALKKRDTQGRRLVLARCRCGKTVNRTMSSILRSRNPSCGCYKIERFKQIGSSRAKPDITGERFGKLLVLGKGIKKPDRNSYRQFWTCLCDCGKQIQVTRGCLENKGQVSCGCIKKLHSGPKPHDISGQKFGNLTAIASTGKKDRNNKPTWNLKCDCGNSCQMSLSTIRNKQYQNLRINCGSRVNHSERYLEYPPTPSPYPKAGELLEKYLPFTELSFEQVQSTVEDEKRDRLLRACWILTYRRQQGEEISELHEVRFIRKHLRFASIDVFWRNKLEQHGGLIYTNFGNKKQIGVDTMTNATSLDYPEIEFLEGTGISMSTKPQKRFKFKRC